MKKTGKVITAIIGGIALIMVFGFILLQSSPVLRALEEANPVLMDTVCLKKLQYHLSYAKYIAGYIGGIKGDTLVLDEVKDGEGDVDTTPCGIELDALESFIQSLDEQKLKILRKYDQDGSLQNVRDKFNNVRKIRFSKYNIFATPNFFNNFSHVEQFEVDEGNPYLFTSPDGRLLYYKDEKYAEVMLFAVSKTAEELIIPQDLTGVMSITIFPGEAPVTLNISEDNPNFMSDASEKLLLTSDGETLVFCCEMEGTVIVPDGVKSVGEYAFLPGANIKLILPESIETVKEWNTSVAAKEILNPDGSIWQGDFAK